MEVPLDRLRQDEDRKFFHYPWYICYQKISDFASKKIDSPLYPTAFELQDGELNSFVLYVGDSAGGLHIIKQIEIDNEQSRQQIAFEIDRSNFSCHRLNINSIMYVPQEHLVITSGFDQMIYAY